MIQNSTKRKRGRPRKNTSVFTQNTTSEKETIQKEDSDIILEMPITLNDVKKYCPTLLNNKNNNNTNQNNKNTSQKMFTFNEMSNQSPSIDMKEYNSSGGIVNSINLKLTDAKIKIKELNKKIAQLKEIIDSNGIYTSNQIKAYEMPMNLINVNTEKKTEIMQTNIACWWCTYNFETLPCFLTEKYENDKYHVFGCFCSFNCASAYNFSVIDDYKTWDRYSLLKKLHKEITGSSVEIFSSPPKEILKKYGGTQTIEEYRKILRICVKEYRILFPPMTSMIPLIEEKIVNGNKRKLYNNSSSNNFSGLKLKRSKPLPNSHSTLKETMGLRIISKQS